MAMAPKKKSTTKNAPQQIMFDANVAAVVNPQGIVPVYANNAGVMFSTHDFRIVFTEIVTTSGVATPTLEMRANIVMSPTMARALYEALGRTLAMVQPAVEEEVKKSKPN